MLDKRTTTRAPAETGAPSPSRRSRRTLAAPAAVAALLLAGLASPATSLAAWSTPVDASATGQDAFDPQIAVAADGDAVIAWQRDGAAGQEIQAVAVTQSGALGTVRTLSFDGENEQPSVAVDDDGNGVVAWRHSEVGDVVIETRSLSESGSTGLRQTLSDPAQDSDDPDVAVDADGDALIVWEHGNGPGQRAQAVTVPAGDLRDAVQTLPATGGPAFSPKVAMAPSGAAAIAWLGEDADARRVRALTVSDTGVLGPIQMLSTAAVDAENVHLGIDEDGDAVVSWLRFTNNQHFRVHARTLSAASALGGPMTLSGGGQDAFQPNVAVGANGKAIVTWTRSDGSDLRVQAVTISAAGVPGTVETLSATGADATDPDVAVDASGDGVITWERFDGNDFIVRARTMSAAGVLGTSEPLSDTGESAGQAEVGVDATGDAHVAWARNDGANELIQAATGP